MRCSVVALIVWLGMALPLCAQTRCSAVQFVAQVESGKGFVRSVGGGLSFHVQALNDDGWFMSVIPQQQANSEKKDDYIYPVNPPIRSNSGQYLGAAYGESTRELVTREKDLRFVLNRLDYENITRLITDALWPYNAKDPSAAGGIYLQALEKMPLGNIHYKQLDSRFNTGGRIEFLKFQITVSAPSSFNFPADLKPTPTPCPKR